RWASASSSSWLALSSALTLARRLGARGLLSDGAVAEVDTRELTKKLGTFGPGISFVHTTWPLVEPGLAVQRSHRRHASADALSKVRLTIASLPCSRWTSALSGLGMVFMGILRLCE